MSFIALSLTQLDIERRRLRDPNGARSGSVYAEDELFTMGRPHFYPEEFQVDDSSADALDLVELAETGREGSKSKRRLSSSQERARERREGSPQARAKAAAEAEREAAEQGKAADEAGEEGGRIKVFAEERVGDGEGARRRAVD